MSIGMNAATGAAISDHDHLRQSIAKILTTPIGSRVMRRTFGSLLPELLDQPLNERTILQLYAATATALLLHEPRFRLTRVGLHVDGTSQGTAQLRLSGTAFFKGQQAGSTFTVPLLGVRSGA